MISEKVSYFQKNFTNKIEKTLINSAIKFETI